MPKLTVYQKKTCITCKKAMTYLDDLGVPYDAKDIVTEPPSRPLLEAAVDENNLKAAMNSRSAIYKEKNLGKATLSKAQLIDLMLADPNLIKRPLIVNDTKKPYLGFDADTLKAYLKN